MNDWQSQDNFSEKVRDKVHDHGDTPSDGLWDKLEQRLDEKPLKKRGFAWWIPVAALLLLGLGGLWLVQDNDQSALSNGLLAETEKTAQPAPVQTAPVAQ